MPIKLASQTATWTSHSLRQPSQSLTIRSLHQASSTSKIKFFAVAALAALASAVALPEADLERRQITNLNGNGLNGNGYNGYNSNPPIPYAGYAPVCSSSVATALYCQLDAIGLADLTCVPPTDTASVEGFKESCSSLGRTPACCALSIGVLGILYTPVA